MIFKQIIIESLGVSTWVQTVSKQLRELINIDTFKTVNYVLSEPIGEFTSLDIIFDEKMTLSYGVAETKNNHTPTITLSIGTINQIKKDIFQDYGDTDTKEEMDDLILDEIEDMLTHELTHIYEHYKAKSNHKTLTVNDYYTYLIKSNSDVIIEHSENAKILNNLLYLTEDIEINAEINKYYNKFKHQLFVRQSDFQEEIEEILKSKFESYFENRVKMKTLQTNTDYYLEAWLDYFKIHIYKTKSYQEIYNILWKKVEDGVKKFHRKLARLHPLMDK